MAHSQTILAMAHRPILTTFFAAGSFLAAEVISPGVFAPALSRQIRPRRESLLMAVKNLQTDFAQPGKDLARFLLPLRKGKASFP